MKDDHIILGIHIHERMKQVPEVQKLFSEYGCYIKTRLGLHEVSAEVCSPQGIVLLEVIAEEKIADEFKTKLNAIDGVDVQKMIFKHD